MIVLSHVGPDDKLEGSSRWDRALKNAVQQQGALRLLLVCCLRSCTRSSSPCKRHRFICGQVLSLLAYQLHVLHTACACMQ